MVLEDPKTKIPVRPSEDDLPFAPWQVDFVNRLIRQKPGNPLGLRIGDLPGGNYIDIDIEGDVTFVGTAGLIFGSMFIPDTDITVTIGNANPTEVSHLATGDGWSAGELNGVTFPTGGTEHYLTIPVAGKYEINWNMSVHTDVGGKTQVHGGIMVNGVATRNNGESHRTVSNTQDSGAFSGVCIGDFPNGTEQISLWVINDLGNDLHVEHGTMTIKQIGGT